jgi:hypothetical protein
VPLGFPQTYKLPHIQDFHPRLWWRETRESSLLSFLALTSPPLDFSTFNLPKPEPQSGDPVLVPILDRMQFPGQVYLVRDLK